MVEDNSAQIQKRNGFFIYLTAKSARRLRARKGEQNPPFRPTVMFADIVTLEVDRYDLYVKLYTQYRTVFRHEAGGKPGRGDFTCITCCTVPRDSDNHA